MPKSKQSYQKLEYYLRGSQVADYIFAAKRPENWVRWPLIVAIYVGILQGEFWVPVAYGVVSLPLSYWLWRRRLGAKTNAEALAIATRANLPARVRRLLKKDKLVDLIGEDGAEALERCAAFAVAAQADQARATMFSLGPSGQLELRKEISSAIKRSMDHAFLCFEANLLGPMFVRPIDPARVAETEQELEKLSTEVAAWADGILAKSAQPDLTPIREQLRAMREMEVGFQLGELTVGDGDLERKARDRE